MKLFLVPLLILLIATQAFSKWVIVLEFKLNQQYIANNLCENRTRPKLQCEGKCQLMKAMEKEDPSNQSQTSKSHFQEVLFVCEAKETQVSFTPQQTLPITNYLLKYYSTLLSPVFHPPAKG